MKRILPAKAAQGRPHPNAIRRLLDKVQVSDGGHDTPCWIFTGHTDPHGYGQIKVDGQAAWAHRISYLIFNGRLSAGQEIDHLCHNPSCINPDHLLETEVTANRRRRKSLHEEREEILF